MSPGSRWAGSRRGAERRKIGYSLSSEEHDPQELVEQARRAEAAGFHALWISDHFHPWNEGFGPKSTELAARAGDGYCTTAPDKELIDLYRSEGGKGPVHAGAKVCFGADEQEAVRTAHRLWPNIGLPGELAQVLPTPAHFEQAGELVGEDAIGQAFPCGPDLDKHAEGIKEFADAGVDELFVQQIGPDQDAFFETWAPEILPRFS